MGMSEAVAIAAWSAKCDEVNAEAIAVERDAAEKGAGIDKKRIARLALVKKIDAIDAEINAFETENAKLYGVVKKSGGGAKPPSQQKDAKKARALKRKLKLASGGGVKCEKCGAGFMSQNHHYKKHVASCGN